MKKATLVLICYLLTLFSLSLLFSSFGIKEFKPHASTLVTLKHPMMIATIITGLIALRCTTSINSFKIFVVIYCSIWLLRIPFNMVNSHVSDTWHWYRAYGLKRFSTKYYDAITKIYTPLPFIIFWFVNFFFDKIINTGSSREGSLSNEDKQ